MNAIERREVEARFALLTREHGWAIGNQVISLLRSIYRRACVDHEGAAQPGRPVAGGRRALQPDRAAGNLVARGSPALLAARHRGGGEGPGDPLDLLGCVTEGYAADWTIGQLGGPAQLIADRIDDILEAGPECEQDEGRTDQPDAGHPDSAVAG